MVKARQRKKLMQMAKPTQTHIACPMCGEGKAVGKISMFEYYCSDCNIEFNGNGTMYTVFANGRRMAI